MTTATSIIQSAYREGNLIAAGKSPSTNEQNEALERLNRYVQGVYGNEMGENLTDWIAPSPQRTAVVAANFPQAPYPTDLAFGFGNPLAGDPNSNIWPYPPTNSRIVFGGVTNTIYFPESPMDGSRMAVVQGSGAGDSGVDGAVLTLNGNGRTIQGAATQTFTWHTVPTTAKSWLYRADLADWTLVVDMGLTDQLPFPSELDDLWITALAIRLAGRYGKTTAPETAALFKKMLSQLQARYRQAGTTVYGSEQMPRSLQTYIAGRWWD